MCEKNSSRKASVRERHFHLGARDRKVAREPESGGRALLPCPMAHATRHARAVSRARAKAARTPKSFRALAPANSPEGEKKIGCFPPVFFGVFVLLGVFLCFLGGAFARRSRAAHLPAFRTRSALCSELAPHLCRTCAALVPHLRRTCAELLPHLCRTVGGSAARRPLLVARSLTRLPICSGKSHPGL